MYTDLHVKHPLFLLDFNETWFPYRFSKNTRIPNFMEILAMEAELSHAGGRTHMTKPIVTLRNLAKESNNWQTIFSICPMCVYKILLHTVCTLGWRNPTRCNCMQILITAKLLYMFRASIAPIIRSTLVTFEEACSPDSMMCTRGCNYSFIYSWWWTRWTPETKLKTKLRGLSPHANYTDRNM